MSCGSSRIGSRFGPVKAGVKFVESKAKAIAERERLELLGYVVDKIAEARLGNGPASALSS
jgi:hypothetical protein